jgi:hypothetical protein
MLPDRCEVCGRAGPHAEGCPYDPTWQPEAAKCPTCGGHGADPMSDNTDWLPCQTCHGKGTLPPRCELCLEPLPEAGLTLCANCELWCEEEAEKAAWFKANNIVRLE